MGDHLVPVLICDQKPLVNKRSSSLAIINVFSFFAVFLKLRKIDRCYLLLDPKVPVLFVLKASSLENNKVIFLQKVPFCSSFLFCKGSQIYTVLCKIKIRDNFELLHRIRLTNIKIRITLIKAWKLKL